MSLDRIGKYEVLAEIGQGTMGTVYKAKDPILNRFVAIKTMPAVPGRNDESKQRFQREAQAAALLAHPNIVTVHDLGEDQGRVFMAMELLEGHDLRDVLAGEGSAPPLATFDEQLAVMEQVAAGLGFAHSKGVVHRDLKPANIHIQRNGQVKIVDFGLARLGGSNLTQSQVVMGTPNYMSPEQALGDKVEAQSDVFSAGGVFYEMLAGRKPFDAETTPGVLYQVVHKEPVPLAKWAPDLPPIMVEVVERCLKKDKSQRFPTGQELRAALGVVRQAVDAGRGDATLAEERQRATEDGRRNESSQRLSPVSSKAPWVEGNVALDPTPAPERRATPPSRTPTLSGRAPTQSGRPGGRGPSRGGAFAPVGLGLVLLASLSGAYWYWSHSRTVVPAPTPSPAPSEVASEQVGALTLALVESQIELASKNLEDKDWPGAIAQAEKALGLRPESGKARLILEQAKRKRAELEAAASQARQAFEAGNQQEASQALGRVLELDPKHPVVAELTTRLNSAFRSRAEEAGRLTERARADALKAKATGVDLFAQAVALAVEGETLFKKAEFADATQRYSEARDGFERARRSMGAAAKAPLGSSPSAPPAEARPSTAPLGGPGGPVASGSPIPTPESTTPSLPTRRFVTGKSVVGSARLGGGLTGFDGTDVKTKKMPDLAGRLEFETEPAAPQAGEAFQVRVYLVNEGKKTAHLRGIALAVTIDDKRSSPQSILRERDVTPQMRGLVAEANLTWPAGVATWSLEAVASTDKDETCSSRLTWQ